MRKTISEVVVIWWYVQIWQLRANEQRERFSIIRFIDISHDMIDISVITTFCYYQFTFSIIEGCMLKCLLFLDYLLAFSAFFIYYVLMLWTFSISSVLLPFSLCVDWSWLYFCQLSLLMRTVSKFHWAYMYQMEIYFLFI